MIPKSGVRFSEKIMLHGNPFRWTELRQDRRQARHVASDMGVEIAKPDIGRRKTLLADLGLDVWILAHFDDGVVQGLQHRARRFAGAKKPYQVALSNRRRRSARSEF